jgi:hypothetical protein
MWTIWIDLHRKLLCWLCLVLILFLRCYFHGYILDPNLGNLLLSLTPDYYLVPYIFVDSYGRVNTSICRKMHWSALVYTVTTNILLLVPLLFVVVKFTLFTVGTWHIQHSNCVSDILRNVHNSYNPCKCHNVQGKFCFAFSIYIHFLFSLCHTLIHFFWTFWRISRCCICSLCTPQI